MRLLGNRVLLERIEDNYSTGGFLLPDVFKAGSVIFKVLDVGLGKWPKFHISPEVEIGDYCMCRAWQDASLHPEWHQPVYIDHADGRGRCIVDARFLLLRWKPNYESTKTETGRYESTRHI